MGARRKFRGSIGLRSGRRLGALPDADGPNTKEFSSGLVSDALLSHALEAVSESSLVTDAQHRIVYANAAFTAVTGFSAGEVIGRNCRLLQGPGTDSSTVAALRGTLARRQTFRGEILNYRKDGTPFWNSLTISPLRDNEGTVTHFVSVQRDITGQKALQERLHFMALHDPVTGLPNRTALDQHLRGLVLRRTAQAVVGIIDLDDFKPVNDTYGHEAGDIILAEFARRIGLTLRETDFIARTGGDEFVIVIEDLTRDLGWQQLESFLSRLHQAVDADFTLPSSTGVQVRMSLGLALWEPATEAGDAVLRRADTVLYELKAQKANRSQWWRLERRAMALPSVHDSATQSPGTQEATPKTGLVFASTGTLRERLFNDGLQMYYQPVVNLRSGELHLVEALARLRLEDGATLEPGAFLPQLNEKDIIRLFHEGLDQTLAQLSAWDSMGHQLRASINIHPAVLLERSCSQWVADALDRHNIAPQRLVLELLEDYVEDRQTKQRVFDELIAIGIGMAQDDLGDGHSNIRRLTALPFETVKIDHKVTVQITTSPIRTMTFLATMITLGQNMGWRVVAEGLESAEITEAATILGIPYGQGYYIARPMPAEQVLFWIAQSRTRESRSDVQSLLGALAFHWQFARLGSPHPGRLDSCPLTRFLAMNTPADDVADWHRQQHVYSPNHISAGTKLLQWLTGKVISNASTPAAQKATKAPPAARADPNSSFFYSTGKQPEHSKTSST